MQTIYATTTHFIRHEGNLVDLAEYRRRLARAQGAPARESVCPVEEEEPARPVRARAVRRARSALAGMVLDWAASAALIFTALTFAVKIL